tara:strand:+ start:194 stop:352 length:159 start_codon:yes stop_codon:yes gene_type:complete
MFARFYKAKEAKAAPDRAYVKDRWTHKVIYAGTVEACQNYVNAFGEAYVETY